MSDVALIFDAATGCWDIALDGPDLVTTDTLETAVIVSLFSDARARSDDVIPDGTGNPRGWWADKAEPRLRPAASNDRLGSRLWLLSREKQIPATLVRLKGYVAEALAWMVEDKLASRIDVEASFPRRDWAAFSVELTRPDGGIERYGYNFRWGA